MTATTSKATGTRWHHEAYCSVVFHVWKRLKSTKYNPLLIGRPIHTKEQWTHYMCNKVHTNGDGESSKTFVLFLSKSLIILISHFFCCCCCQLLFVCVFVSQQRFGACVCVVGFSLFCACTRTIEFWCV